MSYKDVDDVLVHSSAEGSTLLVLQAIARYQQAGSCSVSNETLAAMARVNIRTVPRAIHWLEQCGELKIRHSRGHIPNVYSISLNYGITPGLNKASRQGLTMTLTTPNHDIDGNPTMTSGAPTYNHAGNTSLTAHTPCDPPPSTDKPDEQATSLTEAFTAFKTAYPECIYWNDRGVRESLSKALQRTTIQTIIAGTEEFARSEPGRKDIKYVMKPTRWLDEEWWKEHPKPRMSTQEISMPTEPTVDEALRRAMPASTVPLTDVADEATRVARREFIRQMVDERFNVSNTSVTPTETVTASERTDSDTGYLQEDES